MPDGVIRIAAQSPGQAAAIRKPLSGRQSGGQFGVDARYTLDIASRRVRELPGGEDQVLRRLGTSRVNPLRRRTGVDALEPLLRQHAGTAAVRAGTLQELHRPARHPLLPEDGSIAVGAPATIAAPAAAQPGRRPGAQQRRIRPFTGAEGMGMTSDKAAHDLQPAHPGRRATLTALATLLGAGAAAAQDGRRAIQIYVAAPPGGLPDIVARHFAQRLTGPAGAAVVVENRPGGGGLVAVAQFMRSAPDGQALLLGHSGLLTINPHLYARLPYDAAHDLLPVAPAAQTAFGLAVGPAVPASVRSVADFTAWVRMQGGRVNFGSPGVGTAPHLMGMLLARRGGYQADHVPYLGGPPAMADLVGGRIPALVLPDGLLRQLHLGGRLRVLATSGPQPNPGLPGVPTLAASGHPELVLLEWFGFFLPRGATAALVDSVAAAFRAAATPELGERLDEIGMQTFSASPAELAARLRRDRESWREAAAASGVRIE